jgi:hypothetical protein
MKVLEQQASAGDEGAKQALTEFSAAKAPETTPKPDEVKTGSADTSKDVSKDVSKVDQNQERNGQRDKGPSKLDTIRYLRAKNRELKAAASQVDELRRAVEQLQAQLKTPQTAPTKQPTDDDELAELLKSPKAYRERIRQELLEENKKLIQEALRGVPRTEELQKQAEAVTAFKMLESLPDFDEDEMLEFFEEKGLDKIAKSNPMLAAQLASELWTKNKELPKETIADKKAAASSVASSAKPALGASKTVPELSKLWADASARGDEIAMKQIESEIDSLVKR